MQKEGEKRQQTHAARSMWQIRSIGQRAGAIKTFVYATAPFKGNTTRWEAMGRAGAGAGGGGCSYWQFKLLAFGHQKMKSFIQFAFFST